MSCFKTYGLHDAGDLDWDSATDEQRGRMSALLVGQATDLSLLCACALENLSDDNSDFEITSGKVVGGTDVRTDMLAITSQVLYKVWNDLSVVQSYS